MKLIKAIVEESGKNFGLALLLVGTTLILLSTMSNIPNGKNLNLSFTDRPYFPVFLIGISLIVLAVLFSIATFKSVFGPVFSSKFVDNFKSLAPTQKLIMKFFHESKLMELPLDLLFDSFSASKPDYVQSKGEMYYRIRHLASLGLVSFKTDNNVTTIIWIPKVGTILEEKDLLKSA